MASGTTAVWARPYPLAGDTPTVHTDIQALANSLDAFPPFPTTAATSTTAAAGLSYVVSPSQTLTYPASPTKGDLIRAIAGSTVTGATAVVVAASGGKGINGLGLSSASSFKLGTPGAHATAQYDGTNWQIIDGQQDTGWVALTLATNWIAVVSTVAFTPSARVAGDRAYMAGAAKNNTGATWNVASGTALATLPSFAIPASPVNFPACQTNGTYIGISVQPIGGSPAGGIFNAAAAIAANQNLSFEGWEYRLT